MAKLKKNHADTLNSARRLKLHIKRNRRYDTDKYYGVSVGVDINGFYTYAAPLIDENGKGIVQLCGLGLKFLFGNDWNKKGPRRRILISAPAKRGVAPPFEVIKELDPCWLTPHLMPPHLKHIRVEITRIKDEKQPITGLSAPVYSLRRPGGRGLNLKLYPWQDVEARNDVACRFLVGPKLLRMGERRIVDVFCLGAISEYRAKEKICYFDDCSAT
jgi:hypothetical protein